MFGMQQIAHAATLRLVQVRTVSPDDWRLWREVRLRALADAPDAFGASLAEWEAADETRWRQRLSAVPFNVVAEVGGEPVGQASGTHLDADKRAELISMFVAPAARGLGVADALVAAVRQYALESGAVALRLSVRRFNARAIAVYERAGFDVAAEAGDEPAEVAMLLPLRP